MLTTSTAEAPAPTRDVQPTSGGISPEVWAVAVLTLAGAVLRFSSLSSQSYWYDEAATVHELGLSFGAMLHAVAHAESTPPLYYVLAWVWAKVFGTGEAGLRSLSALAGVGAIPVAYLCGRELVSRWAGAVAAALTALSPFLIWYSQEARAYMLFALLCGLSFLFFARALRNPTGRNLGWWAACSSLAVLTHFFAGFVVAPEAVWLLVALRSRAAATAAVTVAIVQAALVPLLVGDVGHPLLGWIKDFPLSVRIEQIPVALGLGTLYQSSIVTKGLWGAGVLVAILAVLLIAGGTRKHRRGVAVAGSVAAFAILAPIVLAELGRDYIVARNFIAVWIPLAVVLGAAATVPRVRAAGVALAVVALGAFVWAQARIDRSPQYQRPDWRGVASALGRPAGQRAIVLYSSGFGTAPLQIYLKGIPWGPTSPRAVMVNEVDVVGSLYQAVARPLPSGVRLLAGRTVKDFLVERFLISPGWQLAPDAIGQRASSLMEPGPPSPAVLIQHR